MVNFFGFVSIDVAALDKLRKRLAKFSALFIADKIYGKFVSDHMKIF